MAQKWIGPDETLSVGDVGFLIEQTHENQGWTRYDFRITPAHTNMSREPKLFGWCGTTNNLSTHGRGMARVIRVAKNHRVLVEGLAGAEVEAALEELGYPELYKVQVAADNLKAASDDIARLLKSASKGEQA
jgi:hypothetical protein